jgi:hypothetical protein
MGTHWMGTKTLVALATTSFDSWPIHQATQLDEESHIGIHCAGSSFTVLSFTSYMCDVDPFLELWDNYHHQSCEDSDCHSDFLKWGDISCVIFSPLFALEIAWRTLCSMQKMHATLGLRSVRIPTIQIESSAYEIKRRNCLFQCREGEIILVFSVSSLIRMTCWTQFKAVGEMWYTSTWTSSCPDTHQRLWKPALDVFS